MSAGTVVVGAGLAAANVVTTLREQGYAEPVTILGEEPEPPYERPALSKAYLQGEDAELRVHDPGWYAEHDVDLRLGTRAVAVDRDGSRVLTADAAVPYEHLVVATGASPRRLPIPGADLPEVHTLRTRPDSDRLREALATDERWVIVGAGWIGLEVAAAARLAGRDVTVLEYESLPLRRVLGETLGRHFRDLHVKRGVDVRTGAKVEAVEKAGGRLAVLADGDRIEADAVVMAVGIAPNGDLLGGGAIETDECLRTADPHVLAAGDVAAAWHAVLGRRLRVEHWDNAIRQGKLAAATILGTGATFDWQPYFYTDQYDLGMEYVGASGPDDRVVVRGSLDGGEFVAFWLDGDRVTAAMNVNVWDVNDDLRAVVGRAVPEDRLTDEAVPLTDL